MLRRMEETMMPKMPKPDSMHKLAAFWQRHDLTDLEDDLEEVSGPVFRRAHVVGVPLTRDELKATPEGRGLSRDRRGSVDPRVGQGKAPPRIGAVEHQA